MFNLESKIEALLYWRGEPMDIDDIGKSLNVSTEEINSALSTLEEKLKGRGLVLIRKEKEIALATSPEMSATIEGLLKEEMSRDLGKAGLETLSIILYYGPISRRDIDYIRGVNSGFIVKNLLIRGLVEKTQDSKDMRTFLYKPTMDLLRFMGLPKVENLPQYEETRVALESYKNAVQMELDADSTTSDTPAPKAVPAIENQNGEQPNSKTE